MEAAGHVPEYATINIGHPHIVPMSVLAELMRVELGADPELIRCVPMPAQMTLVKHPTLERQRNLLGFEPHVALKEGVRRVCAVQARMAAAEHAAARNGDLRSRPAEPMHSTKMVEPTLPSLTLPSAAV